MSGKDKVLASAVKARVAVRPMAALAAGFVALATPVAAGAPGVPPSYGHSFVTVGAPGNRAALESERHYGAAVSHFPNLGQVNHEYRIARTETTTRLWFDFVQVFWPFADQLGIGRSTQAFNGGYVSAANLTPGTQPGWSYLPVHENVAIETSLRFAARYVNWLHNGRPVTNVTLDTFHAGAYDITTLTRQAGAQYWIPSLDEWTKAVYYDPNRYGQGQEGYWQYSGMSVIPLVGGAPGTPGAQTSGSGWTGSPGTEPPPVGSYPQTLSPWGLLDTSGGVREMTDTPTWFNQPGHRVLRGDAIGGLHHFDRIDYLFSAAGFDVGGDGLRIASAIPAPSPVTLILGVATGIAGRRRRTD